MGLKWTKFSDCNYPKGEPGDTMIVHCENTNKYMVVIRGGDTFWRNAQTGEKELDMHSYMTAWAKIKPYGGRLEKIPYTIHNMAYWYNADKYVPDPRNVLIYVRGKTPIMAYYDGHQWRITNGTIYKHKVEFWQYVRSAMEIN